MRKRRNDKPVTKETDNLVAKEKASHMKRRIGWKSKLLGFILLLYLTVPFAIRFVLPLQHALIYANVLDIPLFTNLSAPQDLGLETTRSFYLQHETGERIGVWHLAPANYHRAGAADAATLISAADYERSLSDGRPVVLYMHGNTGNRAMWHRLQVYKLLAGRGYHCVTFDYRGFGDSDGYATEQGLRDDGHLVWKWIRDRAPNASVFIWGHSLGSAAAAHLSQSLCDEPRPPAGLVLDAPFTNMQAAALNHPMSLPYRPILAYLEHICIHHLSVKFPTIDYINNISCRILIIHGKEDFIIPYHLGRQLYEHAVTGRKEGQGEVTFVDCGNTRHRTNYLSPALPAALTSFIDSI